MNAAVLESPVNRRDVLRWTIAAGAMAQLTIARRSAVAQTATPAAEGVQVENAAGDDASGRPRAVDNITFFRVTEGAGLTMAYPSYKPARWVAVGVQLSGQSVFTTDSPVAVLRKEEPGAFELVSPGTEITGTPGDQSVFFDAAAASTSQQSATNRR